MPNQPRYSRSEEFANAATHGAGAALAVVGLILVVTRALAGGDRWSLVAGAVYGSALVVLFLASTLYHAVTRPRVKRVLGLVDHAAIYLLIAGTYTPFALVTLRGPWGWSVLGVVWGLGMAGIVFEILGRRRRRLSLVFYVGLGWIVVVAVRPLVAALPAPALVLLLVGGLLYSGGALVYASRRLPWNHAIWHVLVLGGSLAHYVCVYRYVVV